jgi:hypothetical protein
MESRSSGHVRQTASGVRLVACIFQGYARSRGRTQATLAIDLENQLTSTAFFGESQFLNLCWA